MEPTDTVGFEFPPIEFSVLMPSPLVSFWLLVLKLHKPGMCIFIYIYIDRDICIYMFMFQYV